MYIWYSNSILASLVSIFGCAAIIVGISDGIWPLAIPGLALIALGKYISYRKEQKRIKK